MDAPTHLLSLKVMRVSRPDLAASWQPFYSSLPSFSAHSSASILSLQGTTPLTGHPKTLRDFTQASELLTLPSQFGSIQLGETFTSCLCVNNETSAEVTDVGLKVEVQTANSKTLLTELGGTNHRLAVAGSLETVVSHEIKEQGQHVLACTVTYRLPPGLHSIPGAAEDPSDPGLQTFRKFYKFIVTNPLSVKTKVHSARSPSALTIPSEKDKVFLEVHIQNSSQQPLYFEQMRFECVEGWEVHDANDITMDDDGQEQSIYPNSMPLIQPQDTRQYVYILSPKVTVLTPLTYAPGSVVPLGRLNIAWRSLFGEPGRLLTSILTRRIPLTAVPPQQQASALPSHLKRSMAGSILSRPQSPQSTRSRPSTPTGQRASSPPPPVPRTIPFSSTLMGRQSPNPTPSQISTTELEAALIVRHVPRNEIVIEQPFTVKLALVISHSREQGQRAIKIAIQHLQPPRVTRTASTMDTVNTRLLSSGTATPTSTASGFNPASVQQNLLSMSRTSLVDDVTTTKIAQQLEYRQEGMPSPTFDGADELGSVSAQPGVVYVGPSTIFLPPVTLGTKTQGDGRQVVQEFEISYVPLRKGFTSFGGLRALLVEDRIIVGTGDEDMSSMLGRERISTLKEWDTIGDIWVTSGTTSVDSTVGMP